LMSVGPKIAATGMMESVGLQWVLGLANLQGANMCAKAEGSPKRSVYPKAAAIGCKASVGLPLELILVILE